MGYSNFWLALIVFILVEVECGHATATGLQGRFLAIQNSDEYL